MNMGEDKERYEEAIESAMSFAEKHEPYLGGTPSLGDSQPHRNWAANLQYQLHGPERGSEKK